MHEFKLRLWPAIAIVISSVVVATSVPFLATRQVLHFYGLIGGPILGTFAIWLWWLFVSRVTGRFRWLPVAVFLVYEAVFFVIVYPDDPMKPVLYYAPVVSFFWVLWLCVSQPLSWPIQRTGVIVTILGVWAALSTVRIDETTAEMVPELRWAWQMSKKEAFEKERSERGVEAKPSIAEAVVVLAGDWPAFRGPKRDGAALSKIRTDWRVNPPKELWRRRVGAGWGSFAVVGERVFTQEQRGNDEAVICYHARTGVELWEAKIPGRFFEGIAGEGPRATPTIHDGNAYAYSATGKLVCVDAASGKELWLRDVTQDVGAAVPQWGFASSPLIIDGKVIVFTAAKGKGVVAYTLAGELAWATGDGRHGYSSPHRAILHGEEQVLVVSDFGVEAFRVNDGTRRWFREWKFPGQNRVAQPVVLEDNEVLLGTAVGKGQGAERFRVLKSGDEWSTERVWLSRSPKPYFNDGVVFEGHYYGWDDRNFVCLNLKSGTVKWNAGSGYGFGQVLLLPQKILLVQAESGEVILLEATPSKQFEIARMEMLHGKTWNHPVVAHGRLYARNGAEAACFDVGEKP